MFSPSVNAFSFRVLIPIPTTSTKTP